MDVLHRHQQQQQQPLLNNTHNLNHNNSSLPPYAFYFDGPQVLSSLLPNLDDTHVLSSLLPNLDDTNTHAKAHTSPSINASLLQQNIDHSQAFHAKQADNHHGSHVMQTNVNNTQTHMVHPTHPSLYLTQPANLNDTAHLMPNVNAINIVPIRRYNMGSQHPHDNENIELQVEEDDDIIDLYYSKRIKLKEQQAKPYKLRIMDTQNKERCGICGLNEEES
eukprot:260017_1